MLLDPCLLPLQAGQKLIAAAAAAAASAARSLFNKQPWDTLEVQMDVVETTEPFFKSGRFFVFGESLLDVLLYADLSGDAAALVM